VDLNLKYPPEPEYAKQLAEICIDAANRVSGLKLDYSVESLRLVEKQLESFREQGLSVDQIASTLFCFGCYVGELLTKHLGGRWVYTDVTKMKDMTPFPIVVEVSNGDCCNPIGSVFRRFEEGVGEDLSYFYRVAASSGR
jgi:hypothetical protein